MKTIGLLPGEGIGPELMESTLQILSVLEERSEIPFSIQFGGAIGKEALAKSGKPLSQEVTHFCRDLFLQGIPILAGPGSDRFVYDLRKEFDLFYKIVPLKDLSIEGRIKREFTKGVDILLVRENASGVYQGTWTRDEKKATHTFQYTEEEVNRFLNVAVQCAARRRGKMAVIVKDFGVPSISALWQDCAEAIARNAGVEYTFLNVDYAAYYLIQHAQELDVVATPNLFGDILGDLGAVLIGSRALTCSGNFSATGAAVYQTNHGCAYDLAGTGRANPVGQLQALGFLLQHSCQLPKVARELEQAIQSVWSQGFRTFDIMQTGCKLVGTQEMTDLIGKELKCALQLS